MLAHALLCCFYNTILIIVYYVTRRGEYLISHSLFWLLFADHVIELPGTGTSETCQSMNPK